MVGIGIVNSCKIYYFVFIGELRVIIFIWFCVICINFIEECKVFG